MNVIVCARDGLVPHLHIGDPPTSAIDWCRLERGGHLAIYVATPLRDQVRMFDLAALVAAALRAVKVP